MNISVAQMRTELRTHLGLDSTELPDPDADLLIDRSAAELMSKFHFVATQDEQTITTVAGTSTYSVPASTDSIEGLYIEDLISFQHSPVDRTTFDFYQQNFQNTSDAEGKPTLYFRRGDNIILYPTPDDVYTLTLYRRKVLGDFSSGGTFFGTQEWYEVVLYGAITRGFHKLGDYQRAQASATFQASLVSSITPTEAKEEYDSHRAGVDFIREDNY
jgi:hypothetical protein